MIRVAIVLGSVLMMGVACRVEPGAQVPAAATSVPQTPLERDEVTGLYKPVTERGSLSPTPSTNPNLQPTVEALVEQRLAEILTAIPTPLPAPEYWPTAEDYEMVLLGALSSSIVGMAAPAVGCWLPAMAGYGTPVAVLRGPRDRPPDSSRPGSSRATYAEATRVVERLGYFRRLG